MSANRAWLPGIEAPGRSRKRSAPVAPLAAVPGAPMAATTRAALEPRTGCLHCYDALMPCELACARRARRRPPSS